MSERPVPRGYRPPLDGLRGVSVLAIVLFHAGISWVHGGYWAVNVFFIVSGYLITGLLLAEHDRWGTLDLVTFYARRAKRLLPALVVAVVGTAVATRLALGSEMPETTKGDGLASLFYVANWRFILTGQSYFTEFGTESPYRHMWTLAIEEQYYLIFPALLLGLIGVLRRRWRVTGALVVLILVSAGLMFWLRPEPGGDASRIYYGTDTRMQDIFTGCALALAVWAARTRDLLSISSRKRLLDVVGIIGLVGLVAALLFLELFQWVYPWGYLLFNTGFAVLVLAVVELSPQGVLARITSVKPLVWVGQLSYSLYLVHWPVIVLLDDTRTGLDGLPLFAVQMVVAFALASVSYYFVENPIRKGRISRWLTQPRVGLAGVAAMVVSVVCVLTAFQGISGVPQVATGDAQRVTSEASEGDTKLLVVGDSVGFSLGYNFPKEDFPDVAPTAQVRFGCGTALQHLAVNDHAQEPGTKKCEGMFEEWNRAGTETKPDVVVWSLGGWEVFDHVVDDEIVSPGSAGYDKHLRSRLEEGLEALPKDTPVFIPNVPCYRQESFVVDGEDLAPDRNDVSRAKAVNKVLEDFAKEHKEVTVPDSTPTSALTAPTRTRSTGSRSATTASTTPARGPTSSGAGSCRRSRRPCPPRATAELPSTAHPSRPGVLLTTPRIDPAGTMPTVEQLNAHRGALNERMGIEIVEATPDRCVARMPVDGNTQPYGILHGGASVVLAEALGSTGAAMHASTIGKIAVGLDINASHHRAAREGWVTGTAVAISLGGSIASYEVTITDEQHRRVCTSRITCMLREAPPGA